MGKPNKLLDRQTFNELKSLLGEDMPMFLDVFFTENQNALACIKTGIAEKDPDLVQAAAHSMKSSCSYLGARQLANLAAYLEENAQQDNINHLKSAHYQAQGMFDIIRSELN